MAATNDISHINILGKAIKKLSPNNPLLKVMREKIEEIKQNEQNPKQKEMGS